MERLLKLKPRTLIILYVILDIACAGAGMGVPIFNILFGFIAGWCITKKLILIKNDVSFIISKSFFYSLASSAVTFILMAVIWLPFAISSMNPGFNYEKTGIPLILYEPKASFIGWIVLMVAISPFMQLLTTVFSSYIALKMSEKK